MAIGRLFHSWVAIILLAGIFFNCSGQRPSQSQGQVVQQTQGVLGGGCDGCEIMYVGMPPLLNATDTSAGWSEKGQRLLIQGRVYTLDGKTPAADVVIYYWQTDNNGYYSPDSHLPPDARRHGHIRGWIKTDQEGRYSLYTIRPAPYPNRDIPAHIHTSIREPGIETEYYIDEFVFDDDKLLTATKREALENRGGSGILKVSRLGDLLIAEHDIVLGYHIPNYPGQ
jgi:protocatechuate 3,4-dioxygenase beta subunit